MNSNKYNRSKLSLRRYSLFKEQCNADSCHLDIYDIALLGNKKYATGTPGKTKGFYEKLQRHAKFVLRAIWKKEG